MTAEEKIKSSADTLEQAVKTWEQMARSGVKLQQEAAKWWSNAMAELSSPDAQKRMKSVADDWIPQAQKTVDEWLKLTQDNTKTCMDLMKKGAAATQSTSLQDAQTKVLGWWEASLNAMCDMTQTMTQANTKALESWMDCVKKTGEARPSAK